MPEDKFLKKILVVDDEKETVKLIERIFSHAGYKNILTAYDGKAAINIIETNAPDLVILDMNMPIVTGYEVIGRMKCGSATCKIPVIIISAYHQEDEENPRISNEQKIFFLPKPFDYKCLLDAAANVLG